MNERIVLASSQDQRAVVAYQLVDPLSESSSADDQEVSAPSDPVAYQEITMESIQNLFLDQIHVSLFSSFLICGTLVGIALFRRLK